MWGLRRDDALDERADSRAGFERGLLSPVVVAVAVVNALFAFVRPWLGWNHTSFSGTAFVRWTNDGLGYAQYRTCASFPRCHFSIPRLSTTHRRVIDVASSIDGTASLR